MIIDPHFGGNFFASLQSSIIYMFWCNLLALHLWMDIFFSGSISFCLCSALVCYPQDLMTLIIFIQR